MEFGVIAYIIVCVWLLLISVALFWFVFKLSKLVKGENAGSLAKTLDKVYKKEEENSKGIKSLTKDIGMIRDADKSHVQKIGIVRFNPFNETGGDQSFSLAVLDDYDNGLVLTGLHTRERTRLYLKPISDLKSDYELSREEQKALGKAVKNKK